MQSNVPMLPSLLMAIDSPVSKSSTHASIMDISPNSPTPSSMQLEDTPDKMVIDEAFKAMKPRFGKRRPSAELDGAFNQPPPPTKLARSAAIFMVPQSRLPASDSVVSYAICKPPSNTPRKMDTSTGTTPPRLQAIAATGNGWPSSMTANFHLEDLNGAWKPGPSTLEKKITEKTKPRLVTPVELEEKPSAPGSFKKIPPLAKAAVVTCCSPSLAMMQQSNASLSHKTSATKPALTKGGSRRKCLTRKPSVTFKEDIQFSPPTSNEKWLCPKNNANVAKPRPIRPSSSLTAAVEQPLKSRKFSYPAALRGSPDGIVDLFPPKVAKALYPSVTSVASFDDTAKTTESKRHTQLPKAPVKPRRQTFGYCEVPVAKNLLDAYARDENRRYSMSAFAPYRHGNRSS